MALFLINDSVVLLFCEGMALLIHRTIVKAIQHREPYSRAHQVPISVYFLMRNPTKIELIDAWCGKQSIFLGLHRHHLHLPTHPPRVLVTQFEEKSIICSTIDCPEMDQVSRFLFSTRETPHPQAPEGCVPTRECKTKAKLSALVDRHVETTTLPLTGQGFSCSSVRVCVCATLT